MIKCEWKKGVRSGKGVETYASGERYEGEYEAGLRSGKGRMDMASGRGYY